MKRIIIAIILFGTVYIIWRKINYKDEKPFKAVIVSVYTKIDGKGYALVLRSADPIMLHEWAAAEVTERVTEWDTVIVDRANGRIIYNDNREGAIIKK